MSNELKNITEIINSLQNKVERLERELFEQSQKTERLVSNVQRFDSRVVSPKDQDEYVYLHKSPFDSEDRNRLTMDQSIHHLKLAHLLGLLLPLAASVAYLSDAILFVIFHNPEEEKHKNYAGLVSTVLLLFYYLQYDVNLNRTHRYLYIVYQFSLWLLMFGGSLTYIYYYSKLLNRPFMTYIFAVYSIIDTIWIFVIGYIKYRGHDQYMFIISIEDLFHLISMVGQLLIIFIPIFGVHEVITTNSVAFFILYEFFSKNYTDMFNLKYSKLSRSCLWILIIFSTLSITFEYFIYAFEQLIQELNQDSVFNHGNNENISLSSHTKYQNSVRYFIMAREISELISTLACYILIILQFFSKKTN